MYNCLDIYRLLKVLVLFVIDIKFLNFFVVMVVEISKLYLFFLVFLYMFLVLGGNLGFCINIWKY